MGTRFNLEGYELEHFLSARNIYHSGSPALAPGFSDLPGVPDTTRFATIYPRQNALQPFLQVPFYAVGAWLFGEIPMIPGRNGIWELPAGPLMLTALFNPLVSAVTVLLISLLAVEFGRSKRQSIQLAVIAATTTMLWPYAGIGLEPLQTALVTGLLWTVIKFRRTRSIRYLIVSVGLMCLLPACKKYSVIFLFPAAIYLMVSVMEDDRQSRIRKHIIMGAGCLVICFLLLASWVFRSQFQSNIFTYIQSVVLQGGVPFWDIIFGLTISPGEGLFTFNPILLFAVPAWMGFYRTHRREALLFLGTAAILLAAVWRLPYLLMDEVWGPRYFHVLIPVMLVAGGRELTTQKHGPKRILWIIVLILSVLIQCLGVLYPGYKSFDAAVDLGTEDLNVAVFTPSLSQISISGTCLVSAVNRYFTGSSLYLEHTAYHSYSGQGLDRTHQIKYLGSIDHPAGGLFTARWLLAETGRHKGSEASVFVLWLILTAIFVSGLMFLPRRIPDGP
jgi:hypothetical protein